MTRAAAAVEARFSILVVEDEAPMRKVLRLILEEQGYEVFECGTGEEALSFISRSPPSLVLLDLGLPDVDGIDLAKQIRGHCPVPIVVLSMRADEHSIVEALDNGADDYVTKPFRENELFARVRACLRNVSPGSAREIDAHAVDFAGAARRHGAACGLRTRSRNQALGYGAPLALGLAPRQRQRDDPPTIAARSLGRCLRTRRRLFAGVHASSTRKARSRSVEPALAIDRTGRRLSLGRRI